MLQEQFSFEPLKESNRLVTLRPGESCGITSAMPAYGETPIIAVIETSANLDPNENKTADWYQIIDMRNAAINKEGSKLLHEYCFDPSVSFLVVSKDVDFDHGKGYKGLRLSDGELQFGRFDPKTMKRDDLRSRFSSNECTSRRHFSLTVTEDGLTIKDTDSANGTTIRTNSDVYPIFESTEEVYVESNTEAMRHHIQQYLHAELTNNSERRGVEKLLKKASEVLPRTPEDALRDVYDIIVNQTLDGVPITPLFGRFNVFEKYDKRIRILSIYEADPDMARAIVVNQVAGFHGSRSGSLWGVVKHNGLLSAAESRRRGQLLTTGERTYSAQGGQPMISFADFSKNDSIAMYAGSRSQPFRIEDLEKNYNELLAAAESARQSWGEEHPFCRNALLVAQDTLQQIQQLKEHPDSFESWLITANFPVAYGLSVKNLDSVEMLHQKEKGKIVERVSSGIDGEFLLMDDRADLEHIPVVAVPQEYISIVQEFFNMNKKQVYVGDIDLLLR